MIGSYRDLAYQSTYDSGNDLVRSLVRKKIDSYQSWDLQYSYTKDWRNPDFGTSVFTCGLLDAFNAKLPCMSGHCYSSDRLVHSMFTCRMPSSS